jgi:hypothetical protein
VSERDRGASDPIHDQTDDTVQQQHREAEDRRDEEPRPDLAAPTQVGEVLARVATAPLAYSVNDQRRRSTQRAGNLRGPLATPTDGAEQRTGTQGKSDAEHERDDGTRVRGSALRV